MPTMIPRSKMSKKARRELDARRRNTWQTSPVTKRVESAKRYDRRKMARVRYDDSGAGFFRAACGREKRHLSVIPGA